MHKKITIVLDNAPSSHKEKTIQEISFNTTLFLIHLPNINDAIHFSREVFDNSSQNIKRINIDPVEPFKKKVHKIRKILSSEINFDEYGEIKIIHSFLDFKRICVVKNLKEFFKDKKLKVYVVPHYEPLRLNDVYVIPRLLRFSLSILFQKYHLEINSIYLFSFLNNFIYKIFIKKLYFYPYKNILKKEEKYFKKKSINSKKKELSIIFVGQLIDRKNPLILINAVKKLRFKVRLSIYGNGYLYKKIQRNIKSSVHQNLNIRLYGNVKNQEILKAMQNHDVLVLPSKFDGFGFVVYEAIKMGLYVIVSDQVGAKDILNDNGAIFSNSNVSELISLLNLQYLKFYL